MAPKRKLDKKAKVSKKKKLAKNFEGKSGRVPGTPIKKNDLKIVLARKIASEVEEQEIPMNAILTDMEREKKPTAKCTMEGLHIIRKSFEDNKNRMLMYKKTCFRHLYDLQNKFKFISYAVHLLLQRHVGDMKFNVGGTTLYFSELDFATILGFRFRPHPPSLKKECMVSENSIRNRLFKDVKYVEKCQLVERFVSCVDDTDAVKLALIIFLEYYLLGSETHTRVNEHYLELVNNLEEFDKYPWGLVSYKRTIEKLARGLNNASPRYNLYGCPFAFQAWAFEHIPELANFCVKEHKGIYFPRMMKWQSTKVIHECDTLKNAIFEKPDLKVIERLVLTKEEKQHKFIRDLLLSHVEDNSKKGGAEGHMKESGKRPNVEENNSKECGEECHMKSQESIKSSNVKDVHNQSLSAKVEICISMLGDISKRLAKVKAWVGSRPHPPHPAKCYEGTSGEYPSHECYQALYKPILSEMSNRLARVEAWMGSQSSQPPPTECHEGTLSKYSSYGCIQTPVQPSIEEAPPSVRKRPKRNIISSDILYSSSVNIDVPIGKKVDKTGLKIDPLRALDKKAIEVVKQFSLEKDKGRKDNNKLDFYKLYLRGTKLANGVDILPSLFHVAGDVEAIYGEKWKVEECSCPKQENNG
ncbi:hypothetical protein HHK36_028324 [Tetracentron sinense]|uniref:DUF1985 domain-containing protein n=1 Tax=Tetracentron sinense TaxID=13715 RepID=A0A835D2D7_TETSI|nr:hypothetical protein HHK36_028324 [Tetracentron sinense]